MKKKKSILKRFKKQAKFEKFLICPGCGDPITRKSALKLKELMSGYCKRCGYNYMSVLKQAKFEKFLTCPSCGFPVVKKRGLKLRKACPHYCRCCDFNFESVLQNAKKEI